MRFAAALQARSVSGVNPHPNPSFQATYAEAVAMYARGQAQDALKHASPLLAVDANDPDLLTLVGLVIYALGDPKTGLQGLNRALSLKTGHAHLAALAGSVAADAGDWPAAEAHFRRAIDLEPQVVDHRVNFAGALIAHGNHEEALDILNAARSLAPNRVEIFRNLAIAQHFLGAFDQVAATAETGLASHPNDPALRLALGKSHYWTGAFEAAAEQARRAMAEPSATRQDRHAAYMLLGEALIAQGDLPSGWPAYLAGRNCRMDDPDITAVVQAPRWRPGEDLSNQTLLLFLEQGLGDELAFLSVVPDILRLCDQTIIACEPRLVGLVQATFPETVVRPRQARRIGGRIHVAVMPSPGETLKATRHAFIGDFFPTLRGTVDAFPDAPMRLTVDQGAAEAWRRRLKPLGEGPFVGLCWRSGLQTFQRTRHYTDVLAWAAAFRHAGATFVSLQYDDCAEEIAAAQADGFKIHDLSAELDLKNDLDGNAALCAALDGVVSAPTAAGALAAAVGTPTCWVGATRVWTQMGTDHCPFFGQSTPFFHPARSGDWASALAQARGWLDSAWRPPR